MKDRYEPDDWSQEGAKILSDENIKKLHVAFSQGPIIVQHWYYRGASCPGYKCFEEFEDFELHLREHSNPGDAFDVWSVNEICNSGNRIAEGKLPDTDGCVPKRGAY